MELSNLKLDEGDLLALTQCKDSRPAIAIIAVAKQVYDREVKRLADGLVGESDNKPKEDFRHCIGTANFAAFIVNLPGEAEKLLSAPGR